MDSFLTIQKEEVMMWKSVSLFTSAGLLVSLLSGCMAQEGPDPPVDAPIAVRVSSFAGVASVPVYIADQKGWFEEEGLEVKHIIYRSTGAQMEAATDAWDLGTTDIDGVLKGTLNGRAVVFAGAAGDVGTHQIFARKDSAIVQAGKGHHSLSTEIYGDAASWKGVEILGPTGSTLQMTIEKTLAGFGLGPDDVRFTDMDPFDAGKAFREGQGDVLMVDFYISPEDREDDILVSTGNLAQTGIISNIVATSSDDSTPQDKEARKRFLRTYFRAVAWIRENTEEAAGYLMEFYHEAGSEISKDLARKMLSVNPFFDLKDNDKMMNAKSENTDYSIMQAQAVRVLTFLIRNGRYPEEALKKFILTRYDSGVVNELLEETKQP